MYILDCDLPQDYKLQQKEGEGWEQTHTPRLSIIATKHTAHHFNVDLGSLAFQFPGPLLFKGNGLLISGPAYGIRYTLPEYCELAKRDLGNDSDFFYYWMFAVMTCSHTSSRNVW